MRTDQRQTSMPVLIRMGHTLSVAFGAEGWPMLARVDALVSVSFIVLGLAAAGWLAWFFQPLPIDPALTTRTSGAPAVTDARAAVPAAAAGVTFDSRRLFRQPPAPRIQRDTSSNVTLSELSRGLSLLGILGGDDPRAIVSDTKTGKTLHLRPGEYVGEIQILEVHAQRVLLGWKNETMEWTL